MTRDTQTTTKRREQVAVRGERCSLVCVLYVCVKRRRGPSTNATRRTQFLRQVLTTTSTLDLIILRLDTGGGVFHHIPLEQSSLRVGACHVHSSFGTATTVTSVFVAAHTAAPCKASPPAGGSNSSNMSTVCSTSTCARNVTKSHRCKDQPHTPGARYLETEN